MTEQEAKMIIQAIPIKIWEQLSPYEHSAMAMLMKSNEKQIAKKPIYKKGFFNAWRCPICDEIVGESHNYCNSCGQKLWEESKVLDWGNEDAE